MTGARMRAPCARQNWGNRASLGRPGAAWHHGNSGEMDPEWTGGAGARYPATGLSESGKSPAAVTRDGAMSLPVARFPQDHVGGAVFGRLLELHEPAVDRVRPEFGCRDLEVDVFLAAGLRDLASAGADLVGPVTPKVCVLAIQGKCVFPASWTQAIWQRRARAAPTCDISP